MTKKSTREGDPSSEMSRETGPEADAFSALLKKAGIRFDDTLPARVSVTDLSNATTHVLASLKSPDRPGVITYRGVPSYLIIPITEEQLAHRSATHTPNLLDDSLRKGEVALQEGNVALPPSNPTK